MILSLAIIMPEKIVKSCFPPELDDFIDLSEKLGEGIWYHYSIYQLMTILSITFIIKDY